MTIVRAHEVQELGYHKHFDPAYIEERMRHAKSASKYKRRVIPRRSSAEFIEGSNYSEKQIATQKPFSVLHHQVSDSVLFSKEGSSVGVDNDDVDGAAENTSDEWYHPSDDIPTGD